jgi:hypothetical protein
MVKLCDAMVAVAVVELEVVVVMVVEAVEAVEVVEVVEFLEVKANRWTLTTLMEEPQSEHASTAARQHTSCATARAKLSAPSLRAIPETTKHPIMKRIIRFAL